MTKTRQQVLTSPATRTRAIFTFTDGSDEMTVTYRNMDSGESVTHEMDRPEARALFNGLVSEYGYVRALSLV